MLSRRFKLAMRRALGRTALVSALALFTASQARAAAYTVMDLYTLVPPAGITTFTASGLSEVSPGGPTVGYGNGGPQTQYPPFHALMWNGTGNAVDLNPTNLTGINYSMAQGSNGSQQVGQGFFDIKETTTHALLWNGSSNSAIDLNPTNLTGYNYSTAIGTNGTQQVGIGGQDNHTSLHAMLWNGSSNTAVDLHPTNLTGLLTSVANGTNGTKQVGYGTGTGTSNNYHALLWNGSSGTAVDLNPTNLTGITESVAYAISGTQQVGFGDGVGKGASYNTHALRWNGNSNSAVDLNPTNITGTNYSIAYGTNGIQQVGYYYGTGTGNTNHAMLWSGTSDTALDLGALLPANFTTSTAYSIDASGNVFGIGTDASGNIHAIEWAAIPEPTGLALTVLGATVLLRRNRKLAV